MVPVAIATTKYGRPVLRYVKCTVPGMATHKTQLERVRGRLHEKGFITRNQCLSQYPAITRLGARIADLKAKGYRFDPKRISGDYVYRLVSINSVPFQPPREM